MSRHTTASRHGGTIVSVNVPGAKGVFLAGTFNGWSPTSHPMKRAGDAEWTLALDIPPGRYEYKFVIDGQWCCEPGCDKAYDGCPGCVANQFGTMNRVLLVEDTAAQPNRQRQLA